MFFKTVKKFFEVTKSVHSFFKLIGRPYRTQKCVNYYQKPVQKALFNVFPDSITMQQLSLCNS